MYSDQRFTNWTPHDPHWSEVNALPARPRPKIVLRRGTSDALPIFERKLAPDFLRPCAATDVAEVVSAIPQEFAAGLAGVYLMGGTARQARARAMTYGMYSRDRIFLFPVSARKLETGWTCSANAAEIHRYRVAGASVSAARRDAIVTFDEQSLRRFYLYDVLLHEVGHHADQLHRSPRDSKRFAHWFAEYQNARLAR
jgi:hypothetical protein